MNKLSIIFSTTCVALAACGGVDDSMSTTTDELNVGLPRVIRYQPKSRIERLRRAHRLQREEIKQFAVNAQSYVDKTSTELERAIARQNFLAAYEVFPAKSIAVRLALSRLYSLEEDQRSYLSDLNLSLGDIPQTASC